MKTMKKIYVDMDDTICDFIGPFKDGSFKLKYPQSKIGFFRELKPIPNAIEKIKELSKTFDIWFLTRPSIKNIHCYTEKAEWIRDHFGEDWLEKLIISPNKSLLKGDILIDDDNRHGQPEFEGEWIQFGKEEFSDWDLVFNYITKNC